MDDWEEVKKVKGSHSQVTAPKTNSKSKDVKEKPKIQQLPGAISTSNTGFFSSLDVSSFFRSICLAFWSADVPFSCNKRIVLAHFASFLRFPWPLCPFGGPIIIFSTVRVLLDRLHAVMSQAAVTVPSSPTFILWRALVFLCRASRCLLIHPPTTLHHHLNRTWRSALPGPKKKRSRSRRRRSSRPPRSRLVPPYSSRAPPLPRATQ